MKKSTEVFKSALQGKKFPILTLDHKWHRLFTQADSSSQIKKLSKELNELLVLQGKWNTESKELRKIKKKLMDEIVESAIDLQDDNDKNKEKKLAENKRLIEECNQKLDEIMDELHLLPSRIDSINYELMVQTMDACYDYLQDNSTEIDRIENWIKEIRIELKKNIIRKQEREAKNHELYSYMHDIFGADVIEIFDMKYNPEEQKNEKKTSGDSKGNESM